MLRHQFDETIQRLNVDERGELLGEFKSDDRLIIIQQNGSLKSIKSSSTGKAEKIMNQLESTEAKATKIINEDLQTFVTEPSANHWDPPSTFYGI